jgi:hypothetical protein
MFDPGSHYVYEARHDDIGGLPLESGEMNR